MTISEYTKQLQWRYATKQFDASKKLSSEQLQFLKDVLQLSPSSTGIQPWKFVIVSDPALRQQLREKAWGQSQITDASHLVVFCRRTDVNEALIDKVIDSTAEARHITPEILKGYRDMMMGVISSKTPEQLEEWSSDQVYIALGMFLVLAQKIAHLMLFVPLVFAHLKIKMLRHQKLVCHNLKLFLRSKQKVLCSF